MPFSFDTDKAVQAAAVLLRREGGRQMSRVRLMKLLYLAHRSVLRTTGRPLFGGNVCAMKNGPVHSEVLELMDGKRLDETKWAEFIQNESSRVVLLIKDPGVAKLAPCEVDALNEVSDQHGMMDDWEVVDCTHALPEWRQHYPDAMESTSRPIPLEDVLDALNLEADKAEIAADAEAEASFDHLFNS